MSNLKLLQFEIVDVSNEPDMKYLLTVHSVILQNHIILFRSLTCAKNKKKNYAETWFSGLQAYLFFCIMDNFSTVHFQV